MPSAPRTLVPLHFPLPAAFRLPKASPDTRPRVPAARLPAEALPSDAEARRRTDGSASRAVRSGQEPGEQFGGGGSTRVPEPPNPRRLTPPLLPGAMAPGLPVSP